MKHLSSDQFFAALSAKTRELRSPESVTFELTYGCNLRCVHCYNPTHRILPQELTTEEVFSILAQLADLGVVELHFSGGEPLVRPDAFDIFRHAKRLGFVLHLLSNATRITSPVAEALHEDMAEWAGPDGVSAPASTWIVTASARSQRREASSG